ncbi:bud site selection protein [Geranomyces variabilis]|uniref:Bud site selection protein n=1 Tax=Geranomyces variabilis TaxID=109894 RepID=A0AAD5TH69_9FUNG|nr:bud site selection protein [Geranomyces variabilis]
MNDYLKKYMSAPIQGADTTLKKRKKKRPAQPSHGETTRIVDEEEDDWTRMQRNEDDHNDDAPVVVDPEEEEALRRAEAESAFRSDAWETIREGTGRRSPSASPPPTTRRRRSPSPSPGPESPQKRARRSPTPSPPPDKSTNLKLSDGRSAGLQTGAAVKADAERRLAEQKAAFAARPAAETGRDAPTVHRDKLGRKVDIAAQKAELLEARRKREAEEERNMKWGTGLVQHEKQLADAKKLAEEANAPLAVYADNAERNRELAERDRWGDPMAFMLAKSKAKKKEVRPKYNGPPPPPNRFGIAPGYRWDGVDRSNGFERKWFLEQNRAGATKLEAYKWSTEDM